MKPRLDLGKVIAGAFLVPPGGTRGNGCFAVEIAAISLSYRELTRDEDQLSTTAAT